MIEVCDKVRFAETDMMGVAHHANFFRWFEMGRVEYLRQAGISLLELIAEDIVCPITEVKCQYKKSAIFDDEIIIRTKMMELSRIKMVFCYQIIREKGQTLLAEGVTQNVFTSRAGNVKRLPLEYFSLINDYAEQDISKQEN